MPMFLILAIAGFFIVRKLDTAGVPNLTKERLYTLKDVDPDFQGGTYKKDFDLQFETVADETGVPFALLKAHAIAESSLKPSAFRDESSGRVDRKGWASRGLMQILWWPNSDRFKKYGYPDSKLGVDGILMFDPYVNIKIAAELIKQNLLACRGNLRDAVNMYNTGKKEADFKAPFNYVDKVTNNYNKILGEI